MTSNVIEKKTEALAQASAAIAQRAYAAGAGWPRGRGRRRRAGVLRAGGRRRRAEPGREDVVDAEFEEVKDKGRKASSLRVSAAAFIPAATRDDSAATSAAARTQPGAASLTVLATAARVV